MIWFKDKMGKEFWCNFNFDYKLGFGEVNNIGFREFELEWGYSWRKVLYVCVCCKNCIFCRDKNIFVFYICLIVWSYGFMDWSILDIL